MQTLTTFPALEITVWARPHALDVRSARTEARFLVDGKQGAPTGMAAEYAASVLERFVNQLRDRGPSSAKERTFIHRLEDELDKQWRSNHEHRCGAPLTTRGRCLAACKWPRPTILDRDHRVA